MNSYKECLEDNIKLNVNIVTLAETVKVYDCHLRVADKGFVMKLSKHIELGEYSSIVKLYDRNALTVVLKYFERIEYYEMCEKILSLIKNINKLRKEKIKENLKEC